MQKKQWVCVAVLALLLLTDVLAEVGKEEKQGKEESGCGDWQWSPCMANEYFCGLGTKEGTRTGTDCKQKTKIQPCTIPCSFGAECEYDFHKWGKCDVVKARLGFLQHAPPGADCPRIVYFYGTCDMTNTKTKLQGALKPKSGEKKKEQAPLD